MVQVIRGAAGVLLAGVFSGVVMAADAPKDMVKVPAGAFTMGTEPRDDQGKAQEFGSSKPWYLDESPLHKVTLDAFWIDKYEVTNAQYRDFVIKNNYFIPNGWEKNGYLLSRDVLSFADLTKLRKLATNTYHLDMDTTKMKYNALLDAIVASEKELDNLPVTGVTWFQARDYCKAQGKRLPSEAEWEKAARGTDGREYPWGNTWDETRLNIGSGEGWKHGVAPVGSYPKGVSPYGAYDMAGNVMEWTADWYKPYPDSKYKSDDYGEKMRVVRGGGWGGLGHYVINHFYRTAYRFNLKPSFTFVDLGFRCAKDSK